MGDCVVKIIIIYYIKNWMEGFSSLKEFVEWEARRNPSLFPRKAPLKHPLKVYEEDKIEALVKAGMHARIERIIPKDVSLCIAKFAKFNTQFCKVIGCENKIYEDRTFFYPTYFRKVGERVIPLSRRKLSFEEYMQMRAQSEEELTARNLDFENPYQECHSCACRKNIGHLAKILSI